jgi:hypothetical protein
MMKVEKTASIDLRETAHTPRRPGSKVTAQGQEWTAGGALLGAMNATARSTTLRTELGLAW